MLQQKQRVSEAARQALQSYATASRKEQQRLCDLIASGTLSPDERMQVLVQMANLSTDLIRRAAELEDVRD